MTTTITPTIRFRKAKNGKWVAFGPTSIVKPGPVTITKADGTTKAVVVESLGRPFDVKGTEFVYGYIAEPATRGGHGRKRGGDGRERCLDCGGRLEDFDRQAAPIPGYHFDCV